MKPKLRVYSMRGRMLLFFALATIVLLFVIFAVQAQLERSVLGLNESYYTSLLIQTAETLDSQLENHQKLSAVLSHSPLLRFYLREITSDRTPYRILEQLVKREILRYPNRHLFDNIYVYIPDMPPINCYFRIALSDTDEYMADYLRAFDNELRHVPSVYIITSAEPYQITMLNPIYHGDVLLGMVRLDLLMDFFHKIIDAVEQDEDSILMILDENFVILFSSNSEDILTVAAPDILEGTVSLPIPSAGWNFAGTLPQVQIQQVMSRFAATFTVMLLLVMLTVTAYALAGFRAALTPMNKMAESMKRVEDGDLDTELEPGRVQEYNRIIASFNSMVKKVKQLLETVYYQQVYLRRAQIGELQSKFSPHFLYNTLDMLYWQLVEKGDDDTAEMVVALSKLLRYSITSNNEFAPISEERSQIENYLFLQSRRLGPGFKWEIDFDPEILDYKIPCLLLQPLVENAINHAFADNRQNKFIGVTGHRQEHVLVLTVADNGVGMSREAFEKILREEIPPDDKSSKLGVGLVHKRLQYIYGEEYGIQVQSEPGKGCIMRVMLEASLDAGRYMAPPGERTAE